MRRARRRSASAWCRPTPALRSSVVLDRTPFYAESGGQVGDTGTITTANGAACARHRHAVRAARPGRCTAAEVVEGDDRRGRRGGRRASTASAATRIRRNHTATHVLHWALREVLGTHVQQAGSFVGPDRLRFDFSHHEALTRDAARPHRGARQRRDHHRRAGAALRDHEGARRELGAIAFFGDKYGDLVRVLEAGDHSIELCGGTHVHALGFIGPIKIVSEGSIGANLRRIEAVTGEGALERIHDEELAAARPGRHVEGQRRRSCRSASTAC